VSGLLSELGPGEDRTTVSALVGSADQSSEQYCSGGTLCCVEVARCVRHQAMLRPCAVFLAASSV
jgi:hypothetical protein